MWLYLIELSDNRKPLKIETNDIGCELIVNRWMSKDGHIHLSNDGKRSLAHRLAYEQAFGEIPEGLIVRHKCDNPNCINPNHLELGTHEDNVKDRVERSRSAKGSNNGRAKLSEEDIRYIRNNDIHSNTELSKMFKVDPKAIRDIKNFKTWKHVV